MYTSYARSFVSLAIQVAHAGCNTAGEGGHKPGNRSDQGRVIAVHTHGGHADQRGNNQIVGTLGNDIAHLPQKKRLDICKQALADFGVKLPDVLVLQIWIPPVNNAAENQVLTMVVPMSTARYRI